MGAENIVPGNDWLLLCSHRDFHPGQILAALEKTRMDKPRLRTHREDSGKPEEKHNRSFDLIPGHIFEISRPLCKRQPSKPRRQSFGRRTIFFLWQGRLARTPGRLGEASRPGE
jgi:hypothetical protein